MFIFPRSRPLLPGNVGSVLNSNSFLISVLVVGSSVKGSIVEADNGIGEASGAVEDEAWGIDSVVEGGRGTGMVRCFEDGVDASAAASFYLSAGTYCGRRRAYHISLDMPARSFKVSPCNLDPSLKVDR
jgi:hypothetical protein